MDIFVYMNDQFLPANLDIHGILGRPILPANLDIHGIQGVRLVLSCLWHRYIRTQQRENTQTLNAK